MFPSRDETFLRLLVPTGRTEGVLLPVLSPGGENAPFVKAAKVTKRHGVLNEAIPALLADSTKLRVGFVYSVQGIFPASIESHGKLDSTAAKSAVSQSGQNSSCLFPYG